MKAASLPEIRKELKELNEEELRQLVLRLGRFKKENKELLTYLLFEADYEEGFRESVIENMDAMFAEINTRNYYYVKKSVRKIMRELRKFVRYSGNKETEVVLLLHFLKKLRKMKPSITRNTVLTGLYSRTHESVVKKINALHEDLQLDYKHELELLSQ